MNNIKSKTKCDFCRYWSGRSCMVTPNSAYCKEALDEFYRHAREDKSNAQVKSLRSWDRK